MNNNNDCCMLEKITDFLIRVGNHCIECNTEQKTHNLVETKTIDVTQNKTIPTSTPMVFYKPIPKPYTHNVKISYLEKWIKNNNFEVFTLDQFFKSFPKQKRNDRLNPIISNLIDKKIISQLGKNKFRVNREINNE